MRPRTATNIVFAIYFCVSAGAGAFAQEVSTNPARALDLRIRSPRANVDMLTTVLLPQGRGPFPLVAINHGSTESPDLRAYHERPSFDLLVPLFVKRGYAVVLPQRPGHGETGGPYLETAGGCDDANYEQAGDAAADSIASVINYMMAQPYVKKSRVLLVGHSAGAWGALALASHNPGLVGGVISFAAGRGGRSYGFANSNCAPEQLVATAALWGRKVKAPTLWIYSVNDTFFGPGLSRRMADAFRAGGAPADYRLLPPTADDGHYLVFSSEAAKRWEPIVQRFLTTLP